jgi:hypothetical protein
MIFIPNNQDLSASSGILNIPFLEAIYHSVMDDALMGLGGNRGQVIFHLNPIVQQDNATQARPAPQQYNPFFGRAPVPNQPTRNPGTKLTPRDVEYTAHIVVGPHIPGANDLGGIGHLNNNEAMITVVIEALQHVQEAIAVSIEGRRYAVDNTRPIGFSKRRYLMVKLSEIQETEQPSPDNTIG